MQKGSEIKFSSPAEEILFDFSGHLLLTRCVLKNSLQLSNRGLFPSLHTHRGVGRIREIFLIRAHISYQPIKTRKPETMGLYNCRGFA